MSESNEISVPDSLTPIDPKLLSIGSTIPFPIYGRWAGKSKYTLLVNGHRPFTREVRAIIKGSFGNQAYTKPEWANAYMEYINSFNFTDERIPLGERAKILYEQATSAMEDLFTRGVVTREALTGAMDVATKLAELLTSDERALRTLIGIASNDYETFRHSVQVCAYGLTFYQRLFPANPPGLLREVSAAFLFHDIGKTRIPESLLKKQGQLTDIEWAVFLNHPVYGDEILREHGITGSPYREIVRHHHEKLDGTGYPDGLKGDDVPHMAQITSIVEIYDALTTNRPYGKKVSSFEALVQMKNDNGDNRIFERKFFEEFVEMLAAGSRSTPPSRTPPETVKAQPKPEKSEGEFPALVEAEHGD